MAFNFNWSPLTADADFYSRARDLLTTALNKSPKPPIIVDDILVDELNLGTVPPDLEILEIGDLAEDRFRGIFKMCYSGDAYLTLKTRVQVRGPHPFAHTSTDFRRKPPSFFHRWRHHIPYSNFLDLHELSSRKWGVVSPTVRLQHSNPSPPPLRC
jgi:hypothetical protein